MTNSLEGLTILAVDDEAGVRESISAFFEDYGATVIQAGDGNEAFEIICNNRLDLVVTDLRMPNMDGFALIEKVKGYDDNLPVVVLSGAGMIHDAIEASRKGAWDFLQKPLNDMEELEITAARAVERSRLIRDNRNYQNNLETAVYDRTRELQKVITAVEQSANAVIITDEKGGIEYVNPVFSEITGYPRSEVIGKNPVILKSGVQSDTVYKNLWQTISSGQRWRGELCNKAKDGHLFWELCSIAPIRDEIGRIVNYVAIKEEITERKRLEEQLNFQANYDPLTGLPNSNFFKKYLQEQLECITDDSLYLTLLVLDIDNLKAVNDTFSHDVGDLLLIDIAKRLEDIVDDNGIVSRFMGDEFIIIPKLTSGASFSAFLADTIVESMKEPLEVAGTELIITVSIGVVVYPNDGNTVDSLLKNAEAAMYQAKLNGKNSIFYYSKQLNDRLEQRFKMQNRLHKALAKDEFRLLYQPQVDFGNRTVVGVEALLRWNPDNEGYTSPALFIPLLEESSLILEVGEWVLREACFQAVKWRDDYGRELRVSVNISALQFLRGSLDIAVERALSDTGLNPSNLCLELTESMIMHISDRTMEKLNELRRMGLLLSLDDFGTGYSSLSYLGSLPINELKIDQAFIRRMLSTRNDASIVNTIIAMGQGLDMDLIAEGVETKEQLDYLVKKGCRTFQGFYFSKALPPEELIEFCSRWEDEK